jgi:hypothetical protein
MRIKVFFFDGDKSKHLFPATFDVTLGQDESVTANKLRGVIMSLGGNFPLPGIPWLRVFGSAHARLAANHSFTVLQLPASQTFTPLNTPTVFIQPIQAVDQDYFRVGMGVDIDHAIQSLRSAKKPS